jgi:hypothetical protein
MIGVVAKELVKDMIKPEGRTNFTSDSTKIPNFKIPKQYDDRSGIKDDIQTDGGSLYTTDSAKIPDFKASNILDSQQRCMLPRNDGEWEDEKGNSTWEPNADGIPKSSNPEEKTWGKILKEHGIKGISFKDGYPDFSEVANETVKIDDFSDNRNDNFNQAEKKTADKWNEEGKDGRTDWKASEIKQYRKDNSLTWHECEDTKTLQLVPSEIHNNIPHTGGISVIKQATKDN